MSDQREHLFISYASEDWPFVRWLSTRLTRLGYRVWCDRFQLLGGESFPKNIDDALKRRTFRVIAVLTRTSLSKPGPSKERELALKISRERKENFLIPLLLEEIPALDLDWTLTDLTTLPFCESWYTGLQQLAKLLVREAAPKWLEGPSILEGSLRVPEVELTGSTTLYSNRFAFQHFPREIIRFRPGVDLSAPATPPPSPAEWPHYRSQSGVYYALRAPSTQPGVVWKRTASFSTSVPAVDDMPTYNLLSTLIIKELLHAARLAGLDTYEDPHPGMVIAVQDTTTKFRWFIDERGKRRRLGVNGRRRSLFWRMTAEYRLRGASPTWELELRTGVQVFRRTDDGVSKVDNPKARASIVKAWYNREQLDRILLMHQCIGGEGQGPTILAGTEVLFALERLPTTVDMPADFSDAQVASLNAAWREWSEDAGVVHDDAEDE